MKVKTSCGARRCQPNSEFKKGNKRTAGAKARPIIHVISSTRGVVASEPPRAAMMTRHTTDAIRRPSFALHVPGGETYFGGCSCMWAVVEAGVVELADGCGMLN